MESEDRQPFKYRFANPRQRQIHRRLGLIGPGPASFYQDACQLMSIQPPFKATTHLIAHLLREIESSLRAVLETVDDREKRSGKSEEEGHKIMIVNILSRLGISEGEPVAIAWLRLPGKDNEEGLARRAHRNALAGPRPVSPEFQNFVDMMDTILDVVLEKFESRYLGYYVLLDNLLKKNSPSKKDIKTLRNHVPNNQIALSYFFDRLNSPAWLQPLKKHGFFTQPPELEIAENGDNVQYPFWPECRYLTRMATKDPETTYEIIMQIPETNNFRVYIDLADAALALPPKLAANLIPKLKKGLDLPAPSLLAHKLGLLIAILAREGQVDAALDLAGSLLDILPDPRADDDTYKDLLEPRAHYSEWEYGEILKKDIPDLASSARDKCLVLLCTLLTKAIRFSYKNNKSDGISDNSLIWRPAIEEHSQNQPDDIKNLLVSAIRDTAYGEINTNRKNTLSIIESQSYKVFQRIGLYLRWKWPQTDLINTSLFLTDPIVLNDHNLQHEIYTLLRDRFGELSHKIQRDYFDYIKKGTMKKKKQALEEKTDTPVTDDQANQRANYWQYKKLYPIQEYLIGKWKGRFKILAETFGEIEYPDFPFFMSTELIGPESPRKPEDLKAMDIDELVSFLKSWKPSGDWMSPSPEGLGRDLTTVVSSDPKRFAAESRKFEGLDPTYVRSIISGFRKAIEQKMSFTWKPIVDLFLWVVNQPRDTIGKTSVDDDFDTDWGPTRQEIANLIRHGCSATKGKIPIKLRGKVWKVLAPLTEDPEPTLEYEAKYGGSNMNPMTLSINTARGEAMHAVIHYAIWIRRYNDKKDNAEELKSAGFDAMPEVREVLDRHLNIDFDKSTAIRAVYGASLVWLIQLDRSWSINNLVRFFPKGAEFRELRDAVWDTYLLYGHTNLDAMDILKDEYQYAVELMGREPFDAREINRSDERLAEHLMLLYWYGKLNIERENDLLVQFYSKSTVSLRAHALGFVGRQCSIYKDTIPSDILERLQHLLEYRIKLITGTEEATAAEELITFGWWFVSKRFDDAWAISQLEEVLKLAGKVEPDHKVVERLAALANSMPFETVRCLRFIIEGDKEGWYIYHWREQARLLLSTVINGTNPEAKQIAIDIINRLGARGFLEFMDLIK